MRRSSDCALGPSCNGLAPLVGSHLPIVHSIIGAWMMQGSNPAAIVQNHTTGNATSSWRGSCADGEHSQGIRTPEMVIAGPSSRALEGRIRLPLHLLCPGFRGHA